MTQARVLAIGTPPTFRQDVARALDCSPDSVEWLPSVTAAEEFVVVQHLSPHVIVLSAEVKDPDALGIADFIQRSSPTTAVVLVRDRAAGGLLPAAMRAGVRDVVDPSRGENELQDALRRAIDWSMGLQSISAQKTGQEEQRGRVISIFSSKGGVGKTFLASNLAAALAKKEGKETALVDFDLKVGDTFSYYGQEPSRPVDDLVALATRNDRDSLLATATELKPNLWGFSALPDPAAESMPGETTGKVVRALRSTFEYTVIDASNDYSDQTVAVFDLSDEIWLVTGLDVVGMRHLLIALDTLSSLGVPNDRLRVVLNRADSKVGVSLKDVERVLKVTIDSKIPSSELVPRSLNEGEPIFLSHPQSEVALAIADLTHKLVGSEAPALAPQAVGSRRKVRLLFGLG
ncbi:MAG: AAA family ATPase [Actinomycetota bacterium]